MGSIFAVLLGCTSHPSLPVQTEVEAAVEASPPPAPTYRCIERVVELDTPNLVEVSENPRRFEKRIPLPTCATQPNYQRRSTLDLPPRERDMLRQRLVDDGGLALVARRGCSVEVLPNCTTNLRYEFFATRRWRVSESLVRADELWANLPARADQDLSGVELVVHSGGTFVPEVVVADEHFDVGTHFFVADLRLEGECEGATHVVAEVEVGAAELRPLDAQGGRVRVGKPAGCGSGSLAKLNARGCLEPLSVALVPLDRRAAYDEACGSLSWNGVACVDMAARAAAGEICFDRPDPPNCRGERLELAAIRPPRLDPARIPCEAVEAGEAELEVDIEGPSGRVMRVCGSADDLDERAALLFELELDVSRELEQHFVMRCPVVPAPQSSASTRPSAE